MRRLILALAAGSLLAGAALAQPRAMPTEPPGKADPARVVAGRYKLDPDHTLVEFAVDHMGFNPYFGIVGGAVGTLVLDPKQLSAAKVELDVPVVLTVANAQLAEHLTGAQFFDTAKFPKAHFVSTRVTPHDAKHATITGELTLKGVTRPIVLEATFTGAGANMMTKAPALGFSATGRINRSAFGLGYGVPMVSDAVDLRITAAFDSAPAG